jgi:hypothetical protein
MLAALSRTGEITIGIIVLFICVGLLFRQVREPARLNLSLVWLRLVEAVDPTRGKRGKKDDD